MRKAIIHIGLEKTGSTFIQDFFFQNQQAIKQHGLYYSRCLTGKNHARLVLLGQEDEGKPNKIHHWVGLEPEAVPAANRDWLKEVQAEESNGLTFWASSEFLSSLLHKRENCIQFLDNLRVVFDEVSIVLFVRKQDDLLLSRYSTSVLDGNHKPLTFGKAPREIDVVAIIEKWAGVVPPEHFYVLPYFADSKPRELIDIFLRRTTGIEPAPSQFEWPEGEVNPRLTFSGLEAIRRINERRGSIPKEKRREALALLADQTRHEQKFTLSDEKLGEASEKFAAINEEISRALTSADRDRFLLPARHQTSANGYDPKLVEQLEAAITTLINT